MQHHARWRSIWFCPIPGCPASTSSKDDLNFYKQTLFHTPFLSRGRAVTLHEYRDTQVIFEVDDCFNTLPTAVERYLLPLQSNYVKWYNDNVRGLTQNYAFCDFCKQKTSNLQRHYMQHHARWRSIWFCPIPGCPASTSSKDDLNFYKQTLFHMPFLSRGRAVTLHEYRDTQVIFEVDDWFNTLPTAVERYLLPLQSNYVKWYNDNVRGLTQNYAFCDFCKQKTSNLQRHYMHHHARWRSIWFCPIPGCPASTSSKDGLVRHLQSKQHARGLDVRRGRILSKQIVNQDCFWPVNQTFADKLLRASKRIIRYVALYSMAGVAIENRVFRIARLVRRSSHPRWTSAK